MLYALKGLDQFLDTHLCVTASHIKRNLRECGVEGGKEERREERKGRRRERRKEGGGRAGGGREGGRIEQVNTTVLIVSMKHLKRVINVQILPTTHAYKEHTPHAYIFKTHPHAYILFSRTRPHLHPTYIFENRDDNRIQTVWLKFNRYCNLQKSK